MGLLISIHIPYVTKTQNQAGSGSEKIILIDNLLLVTYALADGTRPLSVMSDMHTILGQVSMHTGVFVVDIALATSCPLLYHFMNYDDRS